MNATKLSLAFGGQSQSLPLNYFMVNSAVDVGEGYLISGRHTSAVYLVDKQGEILWTLDGETGGSFGPLPPEGKFVSGHSSLWIFKVQQEHWTNESDSPGSTMSALTALQTTRWWPGPDRHYFRQQQS